MAPKFLERLRLADSASTYLRQAADEVRAEFGPAGSVGTSAGKSAGKDWMKAFGAAGAGKNQGWLIKLIVRLGTRDGHKQSTWDWDTRMDVPRRRFHKPPNVFFPADMNRRWIGNQLYQGLWTHRLAISVGIPRPGVADSLPFGLWGAVEQLVVPFLRTDRMGPPEAAARLADVFDPARGGSLTPSFPAQLDRQTQYSTWLAYSLMNGMAPQPLVKLGEHRYDARFSFRHVEHGEDSGLPGTLDRPYLAPDVAVTLDTSGEWPTVVRIRVAYRDAKGGYEDPIAVDMRPTAAPGWQQARAGRIAASAYFLSGQIDQHINRGHLTPEFLGVALRVAIPDDEHPLRKVLDPRFAEVDAVNLSADMGIWGPMGALPLNAGLSSRGFAQSFKLRLGGLDGFRYRPPTTSVHPKHYFPKVVEKYWALLQGYVQAAVDFDSWWDDEEARAAAQRFVDEIVSHSVPFVPWDLATAFDTRAEEIINAGQFAPSAGHEGQVWSRPNLEDRDVARAAIHQLVAYGIYMSTLAHGWANVRMKQTGGWPEYGSLGVRARLDAESPTDPEDATWHEQANAVPADALMRLALSSVLSTMGVDTFDNELLGTTAFPIPRDPLGADGVAERYRALCDVIGDLVDGGPPAGFVDPFPADMGSQLSRSNR